MARSRFPSLSLRFFFFNDTATTEIYPLSLHDALPISLPSTMTRSTGSVPDGRSSTRPFFPRARSASRFAFATAGCFCQSKREAERALGKRSEEHTSELQSLTNLVCRLLLEKKKTNKTAWPCFHSIGSLLIALDFLRHFEATIGRANIIAMTIVAMTRMSSVFSQPSSGHESK